MNDTTYSYYLINKISDLSCELYAYTDRKEFVKRWKKERKDGLFKISKVQLTRTQIHNLTTNRMGEYLIEFKGKTADNGIIKNFSLITTKNEELNVTSFLYKKLIGDLYDICQLNPHEIKSPKHYNALVALNYVDTYDYLHSRNNKTFAEYVFAHEPDLLAGFIFLYGDTLAGN